MAATVHTLPAVRIGGVTHRAAGSLSPVAVCGLFGTYYDHKVDDAGIWCAECWRGFVLEERPR